MKNLFIRLLREEHGQDLVEYALMAAFVAVAALAIMPGVAMQALLVLAKITGATFRQTGELSGELGWLTTGNLQGAAVVSALGILATIVIRRKNDAGV